MMGQGGGGGFFLGLSQKVTKSDGGKWWVGQKVTKSDAGEGGVIFYVI